MSDKASEQPRRHPIFSRIVDTSNHTPASAIGSITERKLRQARDDGFFDDLPGAGKPIADIDQRRPPGWWADRFVAEQRTKLKALRAEEAIRKAMPALWRLRSEAEVIARTNELNTTYNPSKPLDVDETVATWHSLRSR